MTITTVKRYDYYGSCEMDWLDEFPIHWKEKRIKDVSFLQSGNSIVSEQIETEGFYPVYGGNGLRGYFSEYTNNGDHILIGRQGALCGNINYASGKFWASEHAIVVYINRKINMKWFGELLRVMNLNQYSISAAQPGLAVDRIKRLPIPIPSQKEQTAIANYLDEKTTQIDRKIDLLTQKVERYKELKQSLINETVTRGLDKNVPMKESGVEWIGKIPVHWEMKRLKDFAVQSKEKNGITPIGEMLSVSGYRGIEIKVYGNENQKRTTEELVDYRVVRPGQLVVNTMWLNYRGIGVSKYSGYVSPAYRSYHIQSTIVGAFLHYLMRSDLYVFGYSMYLQGIRPNSLQMKTIDFECLPIVQPEIEEQSAIANYLDQKSAQLDKIVETINIQLEKQKEFRKTLINDVVTGKIKVYKEG